MLRLLPHSVFSLLVCMASAALAAEEPAIPEPPEADAANETEIPAEPELPSAAPAQPTHAAPPQYAPGATYLYDAGWHHYRPEAVIPGANAGTHLRYPYYSYRRPWYPAGPASVNVTIIW